LQHHLEAGTVEGEMRIEVRKNMSLLDKAKEELQQEQEAAAVATIKRLLKEKEKAGAKVAKLDARIEKLSNGDFSELEEKKSEADGYAINITSPVTWTSTY
jgi:DNA-binding transcriptional regulator GbsR (MarR family)